MKRNINAWSTPEIYHLSDLAPVLEIYANADFDTSDGQRVLAGDTELQNFYRAVPCTVVDNELVIPTIVDIDTTEDSPDNQQATYSAYLRASGQQLIDWQLNFRIPPSTTTPVSSISWPALRILSRGILVRDPIPLTLARADIVALIEYYVNIAVGTLQFASSVVAGRTFLSLDPALPNEPIAVGDNDPRILKLNSSGNLVYTGGIIVGADSDASGTDTVALQTRGTTRFTIENDGTVLVGIREASGAKVFRLASSVTACWPFRAFESVFSGTTDHGLQFGWNVAETGGREVAGDVAWYAQFESDFLTAGTHYSEYHLNFRSADGLASKRPYSVLVNRASPYLPTHIFLGEVGFNASDSTTQLFKLNNNGILDVYNTNGGLLRGLTNNVDWLYQLNAAGSNSIPLIRVNASDQVTIAPGGQEILFGGDAVANVITGVVFRFHADTSLTGNATQMNIITGGVTRAFFDGAGLNMGGPLGWIADNTHDFGRLSGGNARPRDGYFGRDLYVANQINLPVVTGTAPFVVASATKVANLNVDKLDGQDWADPGAIGGGTPAAASFTALGVNTSLTLADAVNIALNTTTGSKIGTATSQKLAFHNATPVIQRAGAAQAAAAATGATNTTPYGYTTSAQADAIVTLLNEIRAVLVEKGIMKGSA